jgi:hypothetical protein
VTRTTSAAGERRIYIAIVVSSLLPMLAACSGFSLPAAPFLSSSAPASPNQSASATPAFLTDQTAPTSGQQSTDPSKSATNTQKANALHPPSTYTASAPPYVPPTAQQTAAVPGATPSPISDSKPSFFDLFSNKSNNQ